MRDLIFSLIVIFGIFIGAVIGFVGPLLFCLAYDAMTNPSPGSDLMTVGWIFCFFTILGGDCVNKNCKQKI